MRTGLRAIFGILGAACVLAEPSHAQTYRGNLQCFSGFTGVTITGIEFWCSDAPCKNVANCPTHGSCPGLVASFGTGNLSCANVLDTDKVRDFKLTPCNPITCHLQQGDKIKCRRWAKVSWTCSINPAITRSACMAVPGSLNMNCPNPNKSNTIADVLGATFTLVERSPEALVNTECLPPPRSYAGTFHALYNAGLIDLRDPIHSGFTSCDPPPPSVPGATTLEAFNSIVTATMTIGGGSPTVVTAPATCLVRVTFDSADEVMRVYDTEMLQLDISGGTLPPGVRIRESPTLASLGQATLRSAPGGRAWTSSFFDVFTELSDDGGATWFPSTDGAGVSYAGGMALRLDPTTDPGSVPVPKATVLYQNVPNPFNPNTFIEFDLVRTGRVRLRIFDALGRAVRTLVDGDLESGSHSIPWNGLDNRGLQVPSGVYVYQLVAGDYVASKKMILMK